MNETPRRRGRPRKGADATTAAQRASSRRDALVRDGGRRLDILLAPPAAAALAALQAASGTDATAAVSDALLRAADALGGPA